MVKCWGRGAFEFLNSMAREGLAEKTSLSKNLKEVRELPVNVWEKPVAGRLITCAKDLKFMPQGQQGGQREYSLQEISYGGAENVM